jgi:hypothetical protein
MPADLWSSVADYADRISAEAILGLLSGNDVPCFIASNEHVPGLGSAFSVKVPAERRDEALAVLAKNQVSDAELTELALRTPRDDSSNE